MMAWFQPVPAFPAGRIKALKRYVPGWLNTFGRSRGCAELVEGEQWLRRQVGGATGNSGSGRVRIDATCSPRG